MNNDQQEPLDEQLKEYHTMMDDFPGEPEGDGDYTVYPSLCMEIQNKQDRRKLATKREIDNYK